MNWHTCQFAEQGLDAVGSGQHWRALGHSHVLAHEALEGRSIDSHTRTSRICVPWAKCLLMLNDDRGPART